MLFTNEPMNWASFLGRHRRAHVRFAPKAGDPWMPGLGREAHMGPLLSGLIPTSSLQPQSGQGVGPVTDRAGHESGGPTHGVAGVGMTADGISDVIPALSRDPLPVRRIRHLR